MQQIIDSIRTRITSGVEVGHRKELLRRLKVAILDSQAQIYEAFATDMHKCEQEVYLTEIAPLLHEIDRHVGNIGRWSRSKLKRGGLWLSFSSGKIVFEPHGVVLVIAPWNYPFHLAIMPVIGAVAAGNGVVVKPSFNTPTVARVIDTVLSSVFDADHVYVVKDKQEGYSVLDYRWDFVFFTGGSDFGRKVAEVSGRNLTPVCLELGGKSPVVIDFGADLELAAKRVAWGKCLNSGQTCVAPDYAIVVKGLEEDFAKKVQSWMDIFAGKRDELVRIIDDASFDRLQALVESEPGKQIRVTTSDRVERFIEPTVFLGVGAESLLMQAEIFGPLLPIMVVENLPEAIEYINGHDKPLAAYYFGSKSGAKRMQRCTSSGALVINDVIMHIVSKGLPFGGVGASGMGAYHGKYSFELFSHSKPVLRQPKWFDLRARYAPYIKLETIKKIMR